MSISHYCIDRPIFASVISIIITLAGAVAMAKLPVAQYPDITPPQITVSATYPAPMPRWWPITWQRRSSNRSTAPTT